MPFPPFRPPPSPTPSYRPIPFPPTPPIDRTPPTLNLPASPFGAPFPLPTPLAPLPPPYATHRPPLPAPAYPPPATCAPKPTDWPPPTTPTQTDRLGGKGWGTGHLWARGPPPDRPLATKGPLASPTSPGLPLRCPTITDLGLSLTGHKGTGATGRLRSHWARAPALFGGGSQKQTSKGLGRLWLWGKGQSDPLLVQLLRKNSACKFCTHKISMGAKKPPPTLPFAPTRPLT